MVVCISHISSAKIGFVQREIRYAMEVADERPPDISYLFPVLLDDSPIPERFAHIQVAHLTSPEGYEQLLMALRIHASKLGKNITGSESVDPAFRGSASVELAFRDRLIAENYRESFDECFRKGRVLRRRSRGRFSISLLGHHGVGKTALAFVLSAAKFNFLAIEPYEKTYRLLPKKGIFLVDHRDDISLEKHLRNETDIALCLNESKAQGKFYPVGHASASAVLHVPVLTKVDLLDDRAAQRR